ncbi:MAG: hypothetical protein WCS73_11565, partial [Lentisphaeria bacterium]
KPSENCNQVAVVRSHCKHQTLSMRHNAVDGLYSAIAFDSSFHRYFPKSIIGSITPEALKHPRFACNASFNCFFENRQTAF